jgi:hypothetical protein
LFSTTIGWFSRLDIWFTTARANASSGPGTVVTTTLMGFSG